jgi:hypothetical protein
MNASPEIKLADFTTLRLAREDRAAFALNPRSFGDQLKNALVVAAVNSDVPVARHIAARALGAMAVAAVR